MQEQSRCSWLGLIASDDVVEEARDLGVDCVPADNWDAIERDVDFIFIEREGIPGISDAALAKADRVMRRSGRLLMETEALDERSWEQLCERLDAYGFAVDRAWALRGSSATRPMQRIELDLSVSVVAQWIEGDVRAVLAIRVEGEAYPRDARANLPNIVAFQRDYIDASIVRLIVTIGHRIESAPLRRTIAMKVLNDAPFGSADQGAAICVLLYDPIVVRGERRPAMLKLAADYLSKTPDNPTVFRWQVSIAFALARIHQAEGQLAEAAEWYGRVLEFDVLQFSPLLGTKTTAAALALGWMAFARRDLAAARRAWSRGLAEAFRLTQTSSPLEVVGDSLAPETFGMPELAAVIDDASRAAAALRLLAESPIRPGLVWEWSDRSWQRQLAMLRSEHRRQLVWRDELQRGKDWLDNQYRQLSAEVAKRSADVADLSNRYAGLLAAYRLAHEHAEREIASERGRYAELFSAYRLAQANAEEAYANLQEHYSELLSTYHFAHRHASDRIAQLSEQYQMLLATYRLAHAHASEEIAQLQKSIREQQISTFQIQQELGKVSDLYARQQDIHVRLQSAAEGLVKVCGHVAGSMSSRKLQDTELAAEMERLTTRLRKLPFQRPLRLLLKTLRWFSRRGP